MRERVARAFSGWVICYSTSTPESNQMTCRTGPVIKTVFVAQVSFRISAMLRYNAYERMIVVAQFLQPALQSLKGYVKAPESMLPESDMETTP